MKRVRNRQKSYGGWKGRGMALPLIFGVVIALFLLSPMLMAGVNPESTVNQETEIQLSAESVRGDGVHYLGLKPTSPEEAKALPRLEVPGSLMSNLSASVDLSSQLPPVGDQGAQGSCTAWATSYYYKSWSERQEHTAWDLSNPWYQFSPSFVYNQINGGVDEGASFSDAFTLLENSGDVDIAEMPYSASDFTTQPTAAQLEAAKPYRIPGDWGSFWIQYTNGPYLFDNDINDVKAWLDSGEALVMAIPVYSDFPDYGGNDPATYYDHSGFGSPLGGHAVCIVGYDDNINPSGSSADHRGGFKMVNSWGPGWNGSNAGYLYLSYYFVKNYVWEAWSMNDLSPDDPVISSLSTTQGEAGDTIHIYGNNFGTLRRNARVSFNGVDGTSPSFTDGEITVNVPAGSTTGPLKVYDWDGAPSNEVTFTVDVSSTAPTVTGITPSSAAQFGMTNSISDLAGTNFQEGATVRLESDMTTIHATNVVVESPNKITCDFMFFGTEPTVYDVVVKNPDGQEGRLVDAFTVTSLCGQGAGTTLLAFGITLGLFSLLGTGGLLKRKKRKKR